MTILYNPFRAGSGIDINYNTGVIDNTGVLSLDSDTGNLSLSAGTGISISGLTITNTGVDSLVAGTGISISGSTGSVTVTNAGVTSLQGDTGALSLSAGTGISISGLTISNSGVTSFQGDTGSITLTAGTGISISGLDIGINFSGSYTWSGVQTFTNNITIPVNSSTEGTIIYSVNGSYYNGIQFDLSGGDTYSWLFNPQESYVFELYNFTSNTNLLNFSTSGILTVNVGGIILDNAASGNYGYSLTDTSGNYNAVLGFYNTSTNDLYIRSPLGNIYLGTNNAVYTGNTSVPISTRNTLDDGSGNILPAGYISLSSHMLILSGDETSAAFQNDIQITDTGSSSTPIKYIRNYAGNLQFINSAYSATLFSMDDSGVFSFAGGGSIGGSLTISDNLTVSGLTTFETPSRGTKTLANFGTYGGSGVSNTYSAEYPVGVVNLASGEYFYNYTGGDIVIIFSNVSGSATGNAGASSGLTMLSPTGGQSVYTHIGVLAANGSISYGSESMTYIWMRLT